jgi:hypothetical protein
VFGKRESEKGGSSIYEDYNKNNISRPEKDVEMS